MRSIKLIQSSTVLIQVEKINIKKRIRKRKGDLEKLKKSIQQIGLINPIIVDRQYNLIVGERRLSAIQELGWDKIDVRIIDNPGDYLKLSMEIDENLHRKDFTLEEITDGLKLKKRLQMKEEKNLIQYYWFKCIHWIRSILRKTF